MLYRVTQIRRSETEARLRAVRRWQAAFPIEITRQLADLFTASMEAHGLPTLPRPIRGLLRSEIMDNLIDGCSARFLNLSGCDELEISVRTRSEVALEETAYAGDRVHDRGARPAVVRHIVPSPVVPQSAALLHYHF